MIDTRTLSRKLLERTTSCRFEHQHGDCRKVEVEVVVGGGGETAAEGPLLAHDALPAPEPQALLHLVLDEPGDLAVHAWPPHVPRHLHGALGDRDDQQRIILRDEKVINTNNNMSLITS